MSDDYDKKKWQAEQEANDAAREKQREKDERARARKARNAKRKIERLKQKLAESGDLTEWEEEFSTGVTERLTKFDSAFVDREKGRSDDALSYAQKRIVSQLSKKAKGEKDEKSGFKRGSSFKSKKPKFTPRVRQLDDDFEDDALPPKTDAPKRHAAKRHAAKGDQSELVHDRPNTPPPKGKPFLRIVKSDED